MKVLKKLFAPKEVRAALGILDEASLTFDSAAFEMVKSEIEDWLLSAEFLKVIQKGPSARQCVYAAISISARHHVQSGQYHIYRGILNPLGPGEDLLRMFDAAVNELVRLGSIEPGNAQEQKSATRENIRHVG